MKVFEKIKMWWKVKFNVTRVGEQTFTFTIVSKSTKFLWWKFNFVNNIMPFTSFVTRRLIMKIQNVVSGFIMAATYTNIISIIVYEKLSCPVIFPGISCFM